MPRPIVVKEANLTVWLMSKEAKESQFFFNKVKKFLQISELHSFEYTLKSLMISSDLYFSNKCNIPEEKLTHYSRDLAMLLQKPTITKTLTEERVFYHHL